MKQEEQVLVFETIEPTSINIVFKCVKCEKNDVKTILQWVDGNQGCQKCGGNLFQSIYKECL